MKWFMDETIVKDNELSRNFKGRKPFPWIHFDGLFDWYFLNDIWHDFNKSLKNDKWYNKECSTSKKQSYNELLIREECFLYIPFLHPSWLQFLERVTGIDNLIPDPYFLGGGFHNIPHGGFLKMHVDFNIHDKWRLDRRLNVLIFLNENWKPEWGGDLILGENAEVRIPPLFNTTVIFETTDKSWHGHPEPLTCPEGESRKSIALYYYTATNMYKDKPHTTIYK